MIPVPSDFPASEPAAAGHIPCSGEAVSFEVNATAAGLDPEMVRHAAAAVLHYFRHDLGRTSVTVGEFSEALERVLKSMGMSHLQAVTTPASASGLDVSIDLGTLVGDGLELAFFQRLREELRRHLSPTPHRPNFVRCHGLRSCVLRLTGARRWSRRCEHLRDSILEHVRQATRAEKLAGPVGLIIH
jgi:hypothetical protein